MKNTMLSITILILISGLGAGGCAPETGLIDVQDYSIAVEHGDTVRFVMQEGKVFFIGKADGDIEINGKGPGQIQYEETNSGIEITVESKRRFGDDPTDTGLEVRIPEGVVLEISTYGADVTVENINGQVKAVSVAGDVYAYRLAGDIFLKSGRGNVHAEACEGRIRVLGEHGVLRLIDLHGNIASGTIMGTVDFTGSIGEGDEVFLETDHGPVLVTMTEPVNMQVKAWTASGEVACMLAGLAQTVDGCAGLVGEGAPGTLTVKTVSGKIWMENAP